MALARKPPEALEVPLAGQLASAGRLTRLADVNLLGRGSAGNDDDESSEVLGALRTLRRLACKGRLTCRVVGMRRKRRWLVGPPHPQRHRGKYLLQLVRAVGYEQAERAPLAGLERRPPQPEQMPPGGELARPRRLAFPDVLDICFRRSVRNVRRH